MKMLNVEVVHTSDCPVLGSIWCSQCSMYGHLGPDCQTVQHIRRPESLEELIPEDVRKRWGITTYTKINWLKSELLEDKEREISDVNIIEVRFTPGKQDRCIRDVMLSLKIDTVHKMSDNLNILRKWAVKNGKKVVMSPVL